MKELSRRRFLKLGGAALAPGTILSSGRSLALRRFQVVAITNPLEDYPSRDWETVYRDQYAYDDSFTFVCSPNDTHACRRRAFRRNVSPAETGSAQSSATSARRRWRLAIPGVCWTRWPRASS